MCPPRKQRLLWGTRGWNSLSGSSVVTLHVTLSSWIYILFQTKVKCGPSHSSLPSLFLSSNVKETGTSWNLSKVGWFMKGFQTQSRQSIFYLFLNSLEMATSSGLCFIVWVLAAAVHSLAFFILSLLPPAWRRFLHLHIRCNIFTSASLSIKIGKYGYFSWFFNR